MGGGWGRGQGGCERRIEVFGGRWGGVGVGLGGQSGCDRRIEVFVKIQKKKICFFLGGGGGWWGGGVGGGVRMDVNKELKFL